LRSVVDESMESKLHRTRYRRDARGPLDGVRVLDLSRLVAGNVVSHVLADFGAEVIKVEMPGRGDDLRAWKVEGVSTYWKVYARNKKSITLDCRQARGRELLLRLVPTAQVLVENFVPGRLEKMGLAPAELHRHNERLIIVRVSGWGQTGPFAHKPGFGTLVEAMSGFAAMNGYADRPPILPPLATADMLSGLYGASAVLMALRHVEVSGGKGQVIDLSLFEPMLSILGPEAANHRLTGTPTRRNGSRASNTAPRNIYECSDGKFVALSASMQSMAERLFAVMGRPDVLDDPRFRTNTDRVRNNDAIDAIVADFIRQRTQADNLELFDRAGVTVGPVCDAGDLASHPYIVEREVLVTLPDPEMGELPMHNVVPRLSGSAGAIRSPAPDVGEHNEEIFGAIGVGRDELEELKRAQIV
jgi:crotonobetainyl-CoA:carnitine CoA-transferase CaiB-like acyl-CoA transferase